MNRETIFSDDRVYRYTLWREWYQPKEQLNNWPTSPFQGSDAYVQFIGLNPSTADETSDDPTILRCIDFAKQWGFGAMCMTNIFGFRATDPKVMKAHECPEGSENCAWLYQVSKRAGLVVAAWGKDGRHRSRDKVILKFLREFGVKIHCLGTNKDGTPKHPLYLAKTTQPILL